MIAGAIWSNTMPSKLAGHLPFLNETERAVLFGSIVTVASKPRGDPIREGVVLGRSPLSISFLQVPAKLRSAYDEVMKIMVIAATGLSVIPILLSLMMPDWYLGDGQNAVDNADLAGECAGKNDEEARSTEKSGHDKSGAGAVLERLSAGCVTGGDD